MNLQDLPTEILLRCFHSEFLADRARIPTLKALRLTSKRLAAVSSPLLINSLRVYITSESLNRLVEISRHPIFSKSIRAVEINVSFYDPLLANDFDIFAKCCRSGLERRVELSYLCRATEGQHRDAEEINSAYLNARTAQIDWSALVDGMYDEHNPTPKQILLQEAHQEYRRRFDDQESVKCDGEHLWRIGASLRELGCLRRLALRDYCYNWTRGKWHSEFTDKGLMDSCLTPLPWRGAMYCTQISAPPAELIPDLFSTLLRFSIFPAEFEINITAPYDLAVLQTPEKTRNSISRVLHSAKRLSFTVDYWARQYSLAVDNSRPLSEILHLGNLTHAFFDVDTLQSLELSFTGYPVLYEKPQIAMSDILPLSRRWLQLHALVLSYIPLHQQEAATLVAQNRKVVRKLEMIAPYLLSGTWEETVEILRGFEKLEEVSCKYLRGGELGDRFYRTNYADEVEEYILRKREKNPLTGLLPGLW